MYEYKVDVDPQREKTEGSESTGWKTATTKEIKSGLK